MRISARKSPKKSSIGLYLTFAQSEDNRCYINERQETAFISYATVKLPSGEYNARLRQICKIVELLSGNRSLTIHVDWENACQFVSDRMLQQVERNTGVDFRVYNASSLTQSTLDIDALYKIKRRDKKRALAAERTILSE